MSKVTFSRMTKKQKIACVVVAILVILGVGVCVYGTLSNTGSYDNEYAYGSQEDLEEQVREYISNYFTTQNVGKISDDEMAALIGEITNGVLNNVADENAGTQLSAEQQNEIRAIITDSVKRAVDEYYKTAATDQMAAISESVKNELIQYIDNTVVPGLTKQITENTNNISTLKQMYSNLEAKFNVGITQNISGVSKTTLDEEIANAKAALKALIDAETAGRITEDTDLSDRIDLIKGQLETAINERINKVRDDLTEKINSNTELTNQQKTELINLLGQMDATNTSNLNDMKTRLDDYAKGADDALKTAVSELDGKIDTIRDDLSAAVAKMKQYTDDQTQQTVDKINDVQTNYENADQAILAQLNALQNQVSNLLNEAYPVGSLYLSTTDQNPAEFLGGQWEAYAQGRTMIGAGTGTDSNGVAMDFAAGSDGGEYTHTLSAAEMPNHTHSVAGGTYSTTTSGNHQHTGTTAGAGNHSHAYTNAANATIGTIGVDTYVTGTAISSINFITNGSNTSESGWHSHSFTTDASGNHSHNVTIPDKNTSATGGNQAHNNVQPYITVYVWKRIQ